MDFWAVIRKSAAAAFLSFAVAVSASAADLNTVSEGIYGVYSRKSAGTAALASLNAGESSSDWFAYCIGKGKLEDDMQVYIDALSAYVSSRYAEIGMLDKNRATEWHRIAMTIKALGGDPTNVGGINLIKDGITEPTVKLTRQGINGLIWAAVAAGECEADFEGELTLEKICADIAARQNPDGGFSMMGESEPDVTAMAIRALCAAEGYRPYAELARAALKNMQLPSGGYASGGEENSESLSQVILALCAMGESPDSEVDALLCYRNEDGGFAHTPNGKSDDTASIQAMMALLAYRELRYTAEAAEESAAETAEIPDSGASAENAPTAAEGKAVAAVQPKNTAETPIEEVPEASAESGGSQAEDSVSADGEETEKTTEKSNAKTPDEKSEETEAAVISLVGAVILAAAAVWFVKKKKSK